MGQSADGSSPILGWAADGFPIMGNRGKCLSSALRLNHHTSIITANPTFSPPLVLPQAPAAS